ncbi:MAG: hypothetical protein V4709_12215 [Pseudomonadota bacterium]
MSRAAAGLVLGAALLAGCGNSGAPAAVAPLLPPAEMPPSQPVARFASCRAPDAAPLPVLAGLPQVSSGVRPGPALLYAPAVSNPQLQNHHPRFVAAPILVQGQEAYVNGEYLYQDYLYDDYGSDVSNDDLNETGVTVGNSDVNGLEPRVGDIDYPTNFARYGGNAADLVEFRIAPGADDTAYRISLNTLLERDTTITAIVFDMDRNAATGVSLLNRDPGAPFPGTDEVITLWGTGAEHVKFGAGGAMTVTPLTISTDLVANQMWVFVPKAAHNPVGDVAITVAVGLYDAASGGWLMPAAAPTATQPGAVKDGTLFDRTPAGIFNLGFRFDEPVVRQNTSAETFQSEFIRSKQPTHYQHVVKFGDLAAKANRSTVPATGTILPIYASRFALGPVGEGRDLAQNDPVYLGALQPYSLYIPTTAVDGKAHPMHWAFHSNGQQHWQYNGSQYVQQIGEALGAYVPTTLGRGPRNWYDDSAEADTFEVWADIARRFKVDANRSAVTGYSMGGYATYRYGVLYPDLFGKAFSQVGPPGELQWVPGTAPTGGASTLTNLILENVRNLPYLNLNAVEDELVPYPGPLAQNAGDPVNGIDGFEQLGYRHRFLSFPSAEHYTLFLLDNYPMAMPFLADTQVDRNPYHVTYSVLPVEDRPEFDLVHDHAYWVSGLKAIEIGTPDAPVKGRIDAFSHACGLGDPVSTAGASGGAVPLPYAETNRSWGAPPAIAVENKLTVSLSNLKAATLDLPRAGIDTAAPVTLALTADAPGVLSLTGFAGGTRSVPYASGTAMIEVRP